MIRRNTAQFQCKLSLDKATRDALADYCRHRWPTGTAKQCARAFDLTADEGRRVVGAKASQTTIDKIFKAGGWPVIFAVMAEVIGQGADSYIRELRAEHERQGDALRALGRDLWLVAADRPSGPPDLDNKEPHRRRA